MSILQTCKRPGFNEIAELFKIELLLLLYCTLLKFKFYLESYYQASSNSLEADLEDDTLHLIFFSPSHISASIDMFLFLFSAGFNTIPL